MAYTAHSSVATIHNALAFNHSAIPLPGMCWSWGWSVGTGEGATFGPDLPLAEAVVTVAVADLTRMEPPGRRCWWQCMRARMGGWLP